jgi:ribosomal protein L7Ae-like RNA K-turn-binding protein
MKMNKRKNEEKEKVKRGVREVLATIQVDNLEVCVLAAN